MLSTTAEHALRALAEMAALGEGESISGRHLAERAGIPPNYLAKIFWTLGNAGIIDATRGSGGGYRLRRRAEEIRLVDVVDLFDRQKWKLRCFMDCARDCSDADACSAHDGWRGVKAAYQQFLETTTIAAIGRAAPAKSVDGDRKT